MFLSRWIDALSIKLGLIDEGVMTQYSDGNYVILPRVQCLRSWHTCYLPDATADEAWHVG